MIFTFFLYSLLKGNKLCFITEATAMLLHPVSLVKLTEIGTSWAWLDNNLIFQ